MPTASKARPRSTPTWTRRDLVEQVAVGIPGQTPLKIDEANGVIFRVKVLGRFSRNNHGLTEAENGSEYTEGFMRSAIPMYEGCKVKVNHPPDRSRPAAERDVDDTFGILRNVRIESDEQGNPATWADLHYLNAHPLAPRVVEDVKKGLGVYGLSHNASAKRERFDRAARRLVIEEPAMVRSVDLVDKPATNRNLWESERTAVKITLRDLLESQRKRFSTNRQSWMDRLLEMDGMAACEDEMAPETAADPDAALWSGFTAAIQAILDQYKSGEIDASAATKSIGEYLKTHTKLGQKDDPEPASESEEDDVADKEKKTDDSDEEKKEKQESEVEKRVAALESENAKLKSDQKVRELCESEGLATPTKVQLKALALLESDADRKELIGSWKSAGVGNKFKTPKSAATGSVKPAGGDKKPGDQPRNLQESEKDTAAELFRVARAD